MWAITQRSKARMKRKQAFISQRAQTIEEQISVKNRIDNWHQMGSIGEFVCLAIANAFLTNDLEYSISISSNNFSIVANSCHFEGNILRFKALASIKLFERAVEQEDELEYDHFLLLEQAIDSIENALAIYKQEGELAAVDPNTYGIALSNYTLAYIYQNFGSALCDEQVKGVEEFERFLMPDEKACLAKAS